MIASVTVPARKVCAKCRAEKDVADFGPRKHGKDGLHSECRECRNARWRKQYAWAKAHGDKVKSYRNKSYHRIPKEKRRDYRLRCLYGVTLAWYHETLAAQGGRCAVCGSADPKSRTGDFHVDHDHATGAVRGLLCHTCNVGLGSFKDSPAVARSAADYLEHHAAKRRKGVA